MFPLDHAEKISSKVRKIIFKQGLLKSPSGKVCLKNFGQGLVEELADFVQGVEGSNSKNRERFFSSSRSDDLSD